MTLIKCIAVKNPCTQSRGKMQEAKSGRYCTHCCKTVVDFTKMTNEAIIKHLSDHNRVCGRFGSQQFNGLHQNLNCKKTGFLNWKSWALAAILFGFSP